MGQLEAVAAKIIMENRYMVLATSKDDIPWAAPLFFGVDSDLNFYFISGKSTRHATHIKQNPNVAVSIFDSHKKLGEADGVYIEGKAGLVEFTAIPRVLLLVYKKRFPNKEERKKHLHPAEDFWGLMARRFYKIKPRHISKLDCDNETPVDRRVDLNIVDLSEELKKYQSDQN